MNTPAKQIITRDAVIQNSPALHSLKRQQLVQLCKSHSLKANGKNVELIDRLKQHGSGLPPESLDYCWENSDEEADDVTPSATPAPPTRPSEQWEIVMDDIVEVEENGKSAMATLESLKTPVAAGEFGTAGSKSANKFSLKKAITNSLGIKRFNADNANGSSSNPFNSPVSPGLEPIPGTAAKPGTPAPANARLSTGTGPGLTTTIRLISSNVAATVIPTPPRIAPFQTSFDLDMSPDAGLKRPVWPATPLAPSSTRKSGRLYPDIPVEDMIPSPFKSNFATPTAIPSVKLSEATPTKSPFPMPSDNVEDVFSPAKPTPASSKPTGKREPRLSMPNNKPYLFGSPIAQPSFTPAKFDAAAASVLEEMNKRLQEAGVQKVEKTVLDPVEQVKAAAAAQRQKTENRLSGADRFAKAHEDVFNKMDSITNHYAARRPPPAPAANSETTGKKRKPEAAGLGHGPAPSIQRKSSVTQPRTTSGGARKKMSMPGEFGDEPARGAQEDSNAARSSKRIRITENEDVHRGKRVSSLSSQKTPEELRKQERAREATRRHLDAARRRSIQGKASLGVKSAAVSPKRARFGILGAAKALVRGVWGMGAGTKASPAKAVPPSVAVAEKARLNKPTVPSDSTTGKRRVPSTGSQSAQTGVTRSTAASSARVRSPIPSTLNPPQTSTIAPRSTSGTQLKPRTASVSSIRAKTTLGPSGTSSMGARTNIAGPSKASTLSKLPRSGATDKQSAEPAQTDVSPRKRTFSSLLRPTASSLAKQTSPSTLRQITNSPTGPTSKIPSPKTTIFSKPVTSKTFASPVRSADNTHGMTSLGSAAASMLENASVPSSAPSAKPAPRPSQIARKTGLSRARVATKVGTPQPRTEGSAPTTTATATTGAGSSSIPVSRPKLAAHARVRSSMGATPKKEIGVMKNQRMSVGGEALRMKARQSEYARRKSRVGGVGVGSSMDVDA